MDTAVSKMICIVIIFTVQIKDSWCNGKHSGLRILRSEFKSRWVLVLLKLPLSNQDRLSLKKENAKGCCVYLEYFGVRSSGSSKENF